MFDSNIPARRTPANKTETLSVSDTTLSPDKTSTWSSFLKPLSGVVSLCMLCCAIPYFLLFTGIVGASTAVYLKGKVEIAIGVIVISSLAFMYFQQQSRKSKKKVAHENIGSSKDAGNTSVDNQVL